MGRAKPSGERQNSKKPMDNRRLFATDLGIADPWYVESVELAPQELGGPDVLQIKSDFRKGATFPGSSQL